jgi:ELWxxDGT repeat protein
VLYFSAQEPSGGRELWKSDGSAAGTARVADIAPGAASSSPHSLARLGDVVIFSVAEGPGGLWRSDGSAAGTVPLAAVQIATPQIAPELRSTPSTVAGGVLLFSGCDAAHGCELWRSDGSPEGTVMVADLAPGPTSTTPQRLTVAGCTVFFTACGSPESCGVWQTSGAAAGTARILAFEFQYWNARQFRFGVAGETFFFGVGQSGPGHLWAVPLATLTDCAADGFLCYDVSRRRPHLAPVRSVALADRFVTRAVDVFQAKQLCTAAGHDGRPLVDAATHLEGYRIRPAHRGGDLVTGPLTVTNVLGTVTLVGRGPARLLVPTAKGLVTPPSPPDPQQHDVDHYACYRARVAPGSDRPRSRFLALGDQFTHPAGQYLVGSPRHLCVPVDKRGEGIKNTARHLVCYRARSVSSNAPMRIDVPVANQFGSERLNVEHAEELCLPSTEVPPAP